MEGLKTNLYADMGIQLYFSEVKRVYVDTKAFFHISNFIQNILI